MRKRDRGERNRDSGLGRNKSPGTDGIIGEFTLSLERNWYQCSSWSHQNFSEILLKVIH